MPYDPNRHHRRSIRLRGYDYRRPGAYFVTICTYGRQQLFDDPARRQIAEQQWRALAHAGERGKVGRRVVLDAWVVMPDHVHGIIVITTPNGDSVGAQQGPLSSAAGVTCDDIDKSKPASSIDAPAAPLHRRAADASVAPGSLGAIVRSYKAAVARRINVLRHTQGIPVCQRGYYEHIIRDDESLGRLRRYIEANPARWAERRDDLDALLARMNWRDR